MLNEQERIEIVRYRTAHAARTLSEVEFLMQNGFYNTAANRMYYACYYAASALLIANGIVTKSHDGVKQMLGLHFIRTGVFPSYFGKYYGRLFDERHLGDYEDFFDYDETSANDLYPKAKEIVNTISEKVNNWLGKQADVQES